MLDCDARVTPCRTRLLVALILGVVLSVLVWVGGAQAAPPPAALQLDALPGLPAEVREQPLSRDEVMSGLEKPVANQIRAGVIDVAGRAWTNGSTILVVEIVFTSDAPGLAAGMTTGRTQTWGSAALREDGISLWRDVSDAPDAGSSADALLVSRGTNAVDFAVFPAGALSGEALLEIGRAQYARMPVDGTVDPAEAMAEAGVKIVFSLVALIGLIGLAIIGLRKITRGRQAP